MKKNVVCIDRDGTLIFDSRSHLFLGKDDDWKSKVKILPFAIEGLKQLAEIPDTAIYMITNQAGVAISDFPSLTFEKAQEVCQYVLDEIKKKGAYMDGFFLCPHATPDYVKNKPDSNFYPKLVHDCKCLKPALGMVLSALKKENITSDNANIYVIGDRSTDVQTALNINGTGILIPFESEPGEADRTKKLEKQSHVFIAKNLLDAAEIISRKEN